MSVARKLVPNRPTSSRNETNPRFVCRHVSLLIILCNVPLCDFFFLNPMNTGELNAKYVDDRANFKLIDTLSSV